MHRPSGWFRLAFGILAVAFLGACTESPTASRPDASFAKGGNPGGGGAGGGGSPEASFVLPAPTGADGLFSLAGAAITGAFDSDQMSVSVDCSLGEFFLERPVQWPIVAGTEIHCNNRNGFSRLDLNNIGSCSDLANGCAIGTDGHDPSMGTNFSADLNYYFRVKTGPGKSGFRAYDVVWVDGHATVDGTEDADGDDVGDGEAPCRWHLVGTMAEFWDEATGQQVDVDRPMALDVIVQRQDLACP